MDRRSHGQDWRIGKKLTSHGCPRSHRRRRSGTTQNSRGNGPPLRL
ncbi:MAG: hypothetical protein ACK55Z_27505 [bacterium]